MPKVSKPTHAHLGVGPGGMRCSCCFFPPGSKARKKKFKAAKIRVKRSTIKEEMER